MPGYLCLLLHAHLPFVRHPEHERFLEENWLFEAITETYIPLLRLLEGWWRDGLPARLTLTLTPTLCAMLQDELLQNRYRRHLDELVELAEKEIHRTVWEKPFHELALFYHERFNAIRAFYEGCSGNLVSEFKQAQDRGQLELITSAATHALLPFLAAHPPALRAQLLVARDHYRACFGRSPRGVWLPECAYVEELEPALCEAGFSWFALEAHGLLRANPPPRFGPFAPLVTRNGLAAFGRDASSAKQIWSQQEGYPGDPRYRDFYRDIGYDLDLDYVRPCLAAPDRRGFTGIKYHRITGGSGPKSAYVRAQALEAADAHAAHFLQARIDQLRRLGEIMPQPPLVFSPYDAELFGHWWYEGPEFLDLLVRKACCDQNVFSLITPAEFLLRHPTHQLAAPAPSSWGEAGFWGVWLDETNQWIVPHLQVACERMSELARRFDFSSPPPALLLERALRQAARELMLAQASDWPFILRSGTSPDYARRRVTDHLMRFTRLYEQLMSAHVDEAGLAEIESRDNLFPDLDYRYWR